MSIEAIELALEALRKAMQGNLVFDEAMEAFKSLEKSLAQPEQEPVAWYHAEDYKTHFTTNPSPDLIGKYWKPLYTTPPQPKEPKQEQGAPVAVVTGVYGGRFTYAPIKASVILPVGMALYTRPQPLTLRNDVLEEVAKEFDRMTSLGDTAASFACYVRGMKG